MNFLLVFIVCFGLIHCHFNNNKFQNNVELASGYEQNNEENCDAEVRCEVNRDPNAGENFIDYGVLGLGNVRRVLHELPGNPTPMNIRIKWFQSYSSSGLFYNFRDFGNIRYMFFTWPRQSYPEVKIIVHGFRSHCDNAWVNKMAKSFHSLDEEMVVLCFDWSEGTSQFSYPKAARNAENAGIMLGNFLAGFDLTKVHIIGHSLGAHVAHFAAVTFKDHGQKISRISGLDPVGPYFNEIRETRRLNRDDADFVDVIHTSASEMSFGITMSSGHVDFWPNGGKMQPPCVNSELLKTCLANTFGRLYTLQAVYIKDWMICSHSYAHALYIDSIRSKTMPKAVSCRSSEEFQSGACFGDSPMTSVNHFGYHADKDLAQGDLYLLTKNTTCSNFFGYLMKVEVRFAPSDTHDPALPALKKLQLYYHNSLAIDELNLKENTWFSSEPNTFHTLIAVDQNVDANFQNLRAIKNVKSDFSPNYIAIIKTNGQSFEVKKRPSIACSKVSYSPKAEKPVEINRIKKRSINFPMSPFHLN